MASAYHIVPEPAVMVIVAAISAFLLKKRQAIYKHKGEDSREVQLSWQNEMRDRWTARVIGNIDALLNRKHCETFSYSFSDLPAQDCEGMIY